MKILFTVEFYEPRRGGAEEVVKQLAERLVKKGYEVSVATAFLPSRRAKNINGVKIEEFRISGNAVRGFAGEKLEIERYQEFLQSGFDTIVNYAAQIWTTDLAFLVLDKIRTKKIFVPCGYSALRDSAYKKYFQELPRYLKQYDKLVYMSANYQDKIFGDQVGTGDKTVIIPNGASAEEFLPEPAVDIKKQLGIKTEYLAICVANHYRDKGHAFVIEAFKKMERDDTTLLIIGNNPGNTWLKKAAQFFAGCYKTCLLSSELYSKIKLMRGTDRAAVLSSYKHADLFLFGSKVECSPLVMYESFASKTVFITTPVGNVADHKDVILIIRSPEDMARSASHLLDYEKERSALAEKAFRLWRENYTWDKIVEQYEAMLKA